MKKNYKHHFLTATIIGMMLMMVCGCHNTSDNSNAEASDIEKRIDSLLNAKALTSTDQEILHELQIIRGLQEASHKERENTKHKRRESGEKMVDGEYDAMLEIADNTQTDWPSDGWTLFGIVTVVVAVLSFIYTYVTYQAQKKTERHTKRIPKHVQLMKLRDLPRHFYRNLVCSSAIIHTYREDSEDENGNPAKRAYYPSESNLYKLQTLPDDIVLSIDIDDTVNKEESPYRYMHELKLLLRNYNTEVEVASDHLARQNITRESLLQDFDNLLFKPLFLTKCSFDYLSSLEETINGKQQLLFRTLKTILQEHLKKLSEKQNFDCLFTNKAAHFLDIISRKGYNGYIDMNEPKSVDRSISTLLDYYYDNKNGKIVEKEQTYALHYSPESHTATLLRQLVEKEMDKEPKAFLTDIIAIKSKDDFASFYNTRFGIGTTDDSRNLDRLYQRITFYISYLQQGQWDVHTLLKTILIIDTAIEIKRIGRVNF